uniref:microfibril-associated glycoprotein 4-like n=1 Tax=Anopheles coluzzii TaxID=1518534 RepID=UPI0020FF97BB|nr:microfibril-associated glycoprotein 4-like [Anopheles coluzzii]
MCKLNLLVHFALFCTTVGVQCDSSAETSSDVKGGFAFEMIMTKLIQLEDHIKLKDDALEKSYKELNCRIENYVQNKDKENEINENVYKSCNAAPFASSGVYKIQPEKPFKEPITVLCDQEYESGGWIVIQHRFDGSTNFYRNWKEYKNGFGNLDGEFWLGLDRIYQLTVSQPHELIVLLEDFDGNKTFSRYDHFEIGDEGQKYSVMKIEKYSGTAGDAFSGTKNVKFSTFDADNDTWDNHCAVKFTGAWWYSNCHSSNLNGKYLKGETKEYATGMVWSSFRGHYYALKTAKMMIRPKM